MPLSDRQPFQVEVSTCASFNQERFRERSSTVGLCWAVILVAKGRGSGGPDVSFDYKYRYARAARMKTDFTKRA